MLNRVMIIVMFLLAACTPRPVRNVMPSEAPTSAPEEATEIAATPSLVVEETTEATATPSAIVEKETSEITATSAPGVEAGLQKKFTQIAVDDLATQLGVNKEEISVTSAESITWPNAALGCPLPDKVYAQGKVTGFRIRLKVNDRVYDYHTDSTGKIVLCLEPEVEPKEPGLR